MRALVLIVLTAVFAAIFYYECAYPPTLLRRAMEKSLHSFEATMATKDRAKITAALQSFLRSDAKVHLSVSFILPLQTAPRPPAEQDFDQVSFVNFMDNILYTLDDYEYHSELEHFTLHPDGKTADVIFTAKGWGDGASQLEGQSIQMRFVVESECNGQVEFDQKIPAWTQMTCNINLARVPKPGEFEKHPTPEMLQQLLQMQLQR